MLYWTEACGAREGGSREVHLLHGEGPVRGHDLPGLPHPEGPWRPALEGDLGGWFLCSGRSCTKRPLDARRVLRADDQPDRVRGDRPDDEGHETKAGLVG